MNNSLSVALRGHFVCAVCHVLNPAHELYCLPGAGCSCICKKCFEEIYNEDVLLIQTKGTKKCQNQN